MNPETPDRHSSSTASIPETPRRLFLYEPGWRVGLKLGSERIFCYMMAPGQDYYHRLCDGEIFVFHGDEKICLACAMRRGVLTWEARALSVESSLLPELNAGIAPPPHQSGFNLAPEPEDRDPSDG